MRKPAVQQSEGDRLRAEGNIRLRSVRRRGTCVLGKACSDLICQVHSQTRLSEKQEHEQGGEHADNDLPNGLHAL